MSSAGPRIGIAMGYHKHQEFHYAKPVNNFQNTLAFRAGVTFYDGLIENITDSRIMRHIINRHASIVQFLLCDPSTYEHYKTNKKQLHSNLNTVKLLKPIGNNQSKKFLFDR